MLQHKRVVIIQWTIKQQSITGDTIGTDTRWDETINIKEHAKGIDSPTGSPQIAGQFSEYSVDTCIIGGLLFS